MASTLTNKHVTRETIRLWISGKPVAGESTRRGVITNPANGTVIRLVPMSNAADVDRAIKAAQAAFPPWRDASLLERARTMQRFLSLLEAHQGELARLVTEEHGKTLPDAMGSVVRGIEVVEFACGIPRLIMLPKV